MSGRLDPDPLPRRDFLGIAGLWTAGIAIFGSMVGMARLPKPRVLPEASAKFRVGKPEDYPAGTSEIIVKHNCRIFSTSEGIAVLSMVCTHLACIVSEASGGFSCPCHGSKFDADGNVTGGPAPRALQWQAISQAADGSLVIDKGTEIPAGEFYVA